MLNNRFNASLGTVLLLCLSYIPAATAQNNDQNKAMQIRADSLIIDEKKGFSQYAGNVKITQGSRVISGESISIYTKANEISKIVIKGTPATFRHLNDKNESVKASGHEMIFHTDNDILILKQNAVLQQKHNVFRSEEITYNTAQDIITAGNEDTKNERIKITIHPKEEEQDSQ